MDDYALILNAGSSSLKFCVYRRPDSEKWRLEAARSDSRASGRRHDSPPRTLRAESSYKTIWMIGCRDGRAALDAAGFLASLEVRWRTSA